MGAEAVSEAVVVGEGGGEGELGVCEAAKDGEGKGGGAGVEEASKEDVGGAVIGEPAGGGGEEEAAVGLVGAAGVAEGVDYAGKVKGIRDEASEAKAMEEAEGCVGVAGVGTEEVDALRPVGAIGYTFCFQLLYFFFY